MRLLSLSIKTALLFAAMAASILPAAQEGLSLAFESRFQYAPGWGILAPTLAL